MTANAKEFASNASQFLGTSYEKMDCQKFVEAVMKTVGINLDLAGSNTWFRKMDWVGTPEECQRTFGMVPTGAILFILEFNGKEPAQYRNDGKGNASHMGIVTNTGQGAIHSSSSRGCVAESKFKGKTIPNGGWNRIGLSNLFDYGFDIGGKQMRSYFVHGGVLTAPIHMREKASKNSAIVADIPQNTNIDYLSENDGWAKVIYNGITGFVKSEFVKSTESGTVNTDFVDPGTPEIRDQLIEIDKALSNAVDRLNTIWDMIGRG